MLCSALMNQLDCKLFLCMLTKGGLRLMLVSCQLRVCTPAEAAHCTRGRGLELGLHHHPPRHHIATFVTIILVINTIIIAIIYYHVITVNDIREAF